MTTEINGPTVRRASTRTRTEDIDWFEGVEILNFELYYPCHISQQHSISSKLFAENCCNSTEHILFFFFLVFVKVSF